MTVDRTALADCIEHAELRGRSLKDTFTSSERRMLVAALRVDVAATPMTPASKYELAARDHGWILKPNKNGGVFERCASDEPERVHLCGDWQELCKFADINVAAFIPPTEADLKALRAKIVEFILEVDPFGDRFSRREIHLIEVCSHSRPQDRGEK